MAQRIANGMASAMALAYVRDMAHSTPLHYVSRFSHSRFSSDRLPGACHQRPSDTGMRTAADGGGLCDCGRLLDGPPSLAESRKGEPS